MGEPLAFNLCYTTALLLTCSFYLLSPDAILLSHVRRWNRHAQRVQEESRASPPPSEPDRKSGQLLADGRGPTERHLGLSGHIWGQGWPKPKGWHLPGWHHVLPGMSACLLSWRVGKHSSTYCRYASVCFNCWNDSPSFQWIPSFPRPSSNLLLNSSIKKVKCPCDMKPRLVVAFWSIYCMNI